jgi:uncharacterized protein YdbL (DUF1318 family)
MKNKHILFVVTIIACLIGTTSFAGALKERMMQRAPAIATLKAQGVVGENRAGFLEFRNAPQQEALVQAENADRKKAYTAIAKKNGGSIKKVGEIRAEILARKAPSGTWLQNPDGQWYQK